MARYFMTLSYDGTPFHGWQIQPHDNSVQETIEKALAVLLHTPTTITGAGRTDTGVNATMMVAHFDTAKPLNPQELHNLLRSLNAMVGRAIAIYGIVPVAPDAHARFDATSRTYKYFVHTRKSPFLNSYSWHCHYKLNFERMNEAASRLKEFTDFTSFSKLHTDVKTNNCRIDHALWTREGESWVFTITADRFLRNMVRAIVGTLVDVGTGKITVEQFCEIIEKRDRCLAGQSMPGHALFLWNVTYPYPITQVQEN